MRPLDLADGVHRCQWIDGRRAFAKIRRRAPLGFFEAEARGLAALAATHAIRVPEVFAVGATGIVLEELGSGRARLQDWEVAGRGLAAVHRSVGASFGAQAAGWCGDSPQDNHHERDGHRFFSERRLLPQARRAFDAHLLDRDDAARVERICARLPDLLPLRPAVLVHGDLWPGNLHSCANGELALVDGAAVHFGWAEGDLAMLTLFGEPPAVFFSTYESEAGTDREWRRRAPLLNLYHLLNHLNLFGTGYLGAVRDALAKHA